jgi:methionyl-tRNA formyltransferase
MNADRKGTLTLFVMTEKGYYVLRHLLPTYAARISLVVVGSDSALENDYEESGIRHIRRADFRGVETEYALAISWRWLIDHPMEKLIVCHDSLLPRYRGFAPLVNALISGEPQIGVTAILGADKFDAGPVLAQSSSSITYPITISEAMIVIRKNYVECVEEVLKRVSQGQALQGVPQNEVLATYSVWRDARDYAIDWNLSAARIRRLVDALGSPYMGAYTRIEGKTVRICAVEEVPDCVIENRDVGKVLFMEDDRPIVICGSGLLKIKVAIQEDGECSRSLFPLTRFRIRFES